MLVGGRGLGEQITAGQDVLRRPLERQAEIRQRLGRDLGCDEVDSSLPARHAGLSLLLCRSLFARQLLCSRITYLNGGQQQQ